MNCRACLQDFSKTVWWNLFKFPGILYYNSYMNWLDLVNFYSFYGHNGMFCIQISYSGSDELVCKISQKPLTKISPIFSIQCLLSICFQDAIYAFIPDSIKETIQWIIYRISFLQFITFHSPREGIMRANTDILVSIRKNMLMVVIYRSISWSPFQKRMPQNCQFWAPRA